MTYRVKMWYLQESNQGHMDFQSIALPTELRYLLDGCKYKILFIPLQQNYSKNVCVILLLKLYLDVFGLRFWKYTDKIFPI